MSTAPGRQRADYLDRAGTLAVVRPLGAGDVNDVPAAQLEPFVIVNADGSVIAFNGHVDLGTGIRTALGQIVADELDVAFARVEVILGDTALVPDQGATIASETIQLTAVPLRRAAAQARASLVALASELLGVAREELQVEDGIVCSPRDDNRRVGYGALIGGARIRVALDDEFPVKPVSEHRVVGRSVPRVDLPAKATGGLVFVHDMRIPGMLHGRVIRPPHAGLDCGDGVGRLLIAVDERSIAMLPGIVATVVIGDFIGVVAEREEQADAAMRALRVRWQPGPRLPDMDDLAATLAAHPSRPRVLLDRGDVDGAIAGAATRLQRSYVWPYQMHASIGPSAALASFQDGKLTAWSGTQNPLWMRRDLALLLDLPETAVEIIRMEAAGCYGRNGADDVTADAALLSRAVGRPVRVQLTRAQEHQWEPKGAGQLMEVDGGLDGEGDVAAYDFSTRYPSNGAPTLALILTGKITPEPLIFEMGDRTAIGPYDFANHRVTVHDMPPIARASWLRGVSAMPNTYAHESYIDELAVAAGVDPIEFRLRYLRDPRGIDLVRQLAERAGWLPHVGARRARDADGNLVGRGFAYALYVHSKFPGYGAAWAAWVADVAVNPETGDVSLTRVTVGQDAGLLINPEGVRHQIHGNVIQSTSRVLRESVTFSDIAVTSREWGGYNLLGFPDIPPIDVMMVARPEAPPLGVGESMSVPSAAAIANAIFDATGVRFREPPFTPERIREGLLRAGVVSIPQAVALPPPARARRGRAALARTAATLGALAALGMGAVTALAALPFVSAIEPIARPDPGAYAAETIAKGRVLAAIGGCISCHTQEGGAALAGGHAIHTPYGVVYSTNITPDETSGIGAWSYAAFERAMRDGIGRDGTHLYPAFPYTAFAKTEEADLQALYAFLMAQKPVLQRNKPAALAGIFGFRPLMSMWNAAFHKSAVFSPDVTRDALWNRGAYLVEGLGHCAACHSPRNAFGAERGGAAHLGGGVADGWDAWPLTRDTPAPIAWSEQDFFDYLRTGASTRHGAAAGPMAQVVVSLQSVPDDDIQAMAHYLASLGGTAAPALREFQASASASAIGARVYDGACAVCHEPGRGPDLFGVKPSLALNTAVHADRPDTALRVILEGANPPGLEHLGAMPAFAEHLDDAQITELARYMRGRFAPDKPGWSGIGETLLRLRASRLTPAPP